MKGGIDRRRFVKGAALGLAAPGLLSMLGGCGPSPELAQELSGFYSDPAAAAAIGAAYLAITPEEEDRDLLLERLAGDSLEEWERFARRDPEALRAAVRERHREDFEAGRVVRLHGWVLTRTEARLCALAVRS